MFYSNKYPRSVFRELQDFPYTKRTRTAIFNSIKASEDFVQRLKLVTRLPIHNGCVNCICWNETGTRILSGSDDQHLNVTDPFTYKVLAQYRTNHRANIFSAKFLPNCGDNAVISCSGEGSILYTDLSRVEETQDCLFNCHHGTTYDVVTIPNDPNVFLSCGEDYTVRSFDLRVKNKCNKVKCKEDVIIQCRRAVTAITVNQLMPYQIAIGCADSTVRIYDRRMVEGLKTRLNPIDAFIAPGLEKKSHRITSLNFSPEGDDLLVSYSSEHVYLFGIRNSRETIFSLDSLYGSDEESGSGVGLGPEDKGDNLPVRRLRLRGDWSDTGPDARPHSNSPATASHAGGRRVVQGGLIQRMTDVLSRMLNDPATRAALSHGGESEPSDQMQFEEGLGEYLNIGSRRRASEGNLDELGAASETSRIVQSEHNSEDIAEINENLVVDVVQNEQHAIMECEQNEQIVETSSEQVESNILERGDINMDVSSEGGASYHSEDPISNPVSNGGHRTPKMEFLDEQSPQPECSSNKETQNMETDEIIADSSLSDDVIAESSSKLLPLNLNNSSNQVGIDESNSSIPTDDSSTECQVCKAQHLPNCTCSSSQQTNEEAPPSNNPSDSSTHQEEDDAFPSSSGERRALTDLTDELSTMFDGFKQKYGRKPMVNFVYSVRGSTASTISMAVDDQMINAPPNSQVDLDYLDDPVQVVKIPPREQPEEEPSSSSSDPAGTSSSSPVPPTLTAPHPSSPSPTPSPPSPLSNQMPSDPPDIPSQSSPPIDSAPSPEVPISNPPPDSFSHTQTTMSESPSNPSSSSDDPAMSNSTVSSTTTPTNPPVTIFVKLRPPFSPFTAPPTSVANETQSTTSPSVPEVTPPATPSSQAPPSTTTSSDTPSTSSTQHLLLSSSTSTTFAVRMEKELCKAIRNARTETNQDETVKLKKAFIRMKYSGHRNARTMIKESTFWGSDYVMSGSDCGHVFIWSRETGRLMMTLQADNHVVNCLQPHPTLPILATSGIDYDVKLWAPYAPEPCFDYAATQELMNRNAIMLEETKDTITVPASFMIRMLACLNQLRRGGPRIMRRRRHPEQ